MGPSNTVDGKYKALNAKRYGRSPGNASCCDPPEDGKYKEGEHILRAKIDMKPKPR